MNTPDTPTPRTTEARIHNSNFNDWGTGKSEFVLADFARQLERELTAAKEEITGLRVDLSNAAVLAYESDDTIALLRKRVEAADGLLQQMLDVAENCDETGYVDGEGFVGLDKLHGTVRTHLQAYRATEGKK